jgi:hypothetical protein
MSKKCWSSFRYLLPTDGSGIRFSIAHFSPAIAKSPTMSQGSKAAANMEFVPHRPIIRVRFGQFGFVFLFRA